MKKFLLLFFIAFVSISKIDAQCTNQILFQNFDNNSPASPPAGWIVKNVDFDSTQFTPSLSGFKRLNMNAITDSIISKQLYCPGTMSFYWRSSSNAANYTVLLQYSSDLITWTDFDSILTSGVGTTNIYTKKTVNVPSANLIAPFKTYIRWNMTRKVGTGTFMFDDLCISAGVCSVVPTKLVFTNIPSNCVPSGTSMNFSVCATDNNGFIDSTYNTPITVSKVTGTGTLSGTTMASPSNGCASFNGIKFSGVAPLTLTASSGTLTSTANLTTLDIRATCPNVDTFSVVTYNLLNFPEGGVYALGSVLCNIQEIGPNRWDTLKAIMQYMKPDIMIVQELQTEAGADSVVSAALNKWAGAGKYAKAPYIENKSTASKKYNNECFYNTDKLVLYQTNTLGNTTRDCGQYILYCKDPLLNVHHDTTWIDLYSIHTKAKGQGVAQAAADSEQRSNDCILVMDSIRYRQSSARNAIIGGDMNLYTNTEGAYQAFTTGLYKFNDPVNQPGAWESNVAYAPLHTQAARSGSRLSLECGARGGLDSRLDFLLCTDPIMSNGKRMQYIPNTYTAFGNSGNLFNKSVDTSTNTSGIPANVLRSLANMSDHLPVVLKLAVAYPLVNAPLASNNIKLNANWINDNATINWNINIDKKISKVVLMHSPDGSNATFTDIFEDVTAANYNSFVDAKIKPGTSFYRLKIFDEISNITLSEVVKLTANGITPSSISPNPFVNNININVYHTQANANTTGFLYNANGTIVAKININGIGNINYDLNTATLKPGVYLLMLQNNNQFEKVKLIKY
jgi:Secretion system C-terminal sorting domain